MGVAGHTYGFQFNFIKKTYAVFGCEIIVLDDMEDVSDADGLTRDLMVEEV